MTTLRIVFGVLALGFVVVTLVGRWDDVQDRLEELSWISIGGAFATAVLALIALLMAWRALVADLGSPLPVPVAARVLFPAQLAKYIPGGLWTVVAQSGRARAAGVSRRRSGAAALAHNFLTLGVGLLIGALSLPVLLESEVPVWMKAVVALSPVGLVFLVPAVMTRLFNQLFRLLRRPALERPFSWAGVGRATSWTLLYWLFMSLHIFALGRALGGGGAGFFVASAGGFAVAWSVGFLVIFAPAGAGARELLLTAVLASHLPGGSDAAIAIAVVSRLLTMLADLLVAGVSIVVPDPSKVTRQRRQRARVS